MAIAGVPEIEIEQAQFMIKIRPKKTLNYLSPYEFITGKSMSLIAGI
ncbi:MAG: IS30 family transposase [Paraglaciecola sp.]|jgi:IS30 family transposase